jgi:signal transduction histidine kinase
MIKYLERIEGNEEAVTKARTSLDVIGRRSKALMDFVHRYREVSNVPAPRLEHSSIADVISAVLHLLQDDLSEIEVSVRHQSGYILMDSSQIEQVLINLVRNAIHSMKESRSKRLTIIEEEADGITRVSVSDTGSGIPADMLDKIFIPFFTTRKDGSGIGLTLSKQIMHRHDGQILVSSEPGRGTSFILIFNHTKPT